MAYFSRHICPDQFSLTNEEAKKNDFYEVHVFIPSASNDEISRIPKKNRGALRIRCEFMPISNAARWGDILAGRIKYVRDTEFREGFLSAEYLRYSRIDVNYFFGHWNFREQDCTLGTLIYLFLLRFVRSAYISIAKSKLSSFVKKLNANRKLRSPLRSKYEIYEALMNNDDFLRRGSFRKSELTQTLFGNHYKGDYRIYQKVSKSLDWILEACVDDGEIKKIGNQDDPLYEMQGKGIHYFTLTKEVIKNDEANKNIQQQQISIQRWMVLLTVLLVIGTFLSAIDKIEKLNELWLSLMGTLQPLIEMVRGKFI